MDSQKSVETQTDTDPESEVNMCAVEFSNIFVYFVYFLIINFFKMNHVICDWWNSLYLPPKTLYLLRIFLDVNI